MNADVAWNQDIICPSPDSNIAVDTFNLQTLNILRELWARNIELVDGFGILGGVEP